MTAVTVTLGCHTTLQRAADEEENHMSTNLVNHCGHLRSRCSSDGSSNTSATIMIESDNISDMASRQHGRSVRFLTDADGGILELVYSYDSVPHRYKRRVYLNQEQLLLKKRAARAYCSLYTRIHPEYISCIDCLFESPLRNASRQHGMDTADALATIAVSEARGMERHMNDLIIRHQRYTLRTMLAQFRALKRCDKFSRVEKDEMLRKRSLELSSCTAKFAIYLAMGDECEAQCVYAGGYEV